MITIYDSFHNLIYQMKEELFVEQKVFHFLTHINLEYCY